MTSATDSLDTPSISERERRQIIEQCAESKRYTLCRNEIAIRSNTRFPIENYDRMYGGFASLSPTAGPADIEVFCLDERQGGQRTFTVLSGDTVYRLTRPDLADRLFVTLAHLVAVNIRSHYLVHASCVSRNGRASVMPGPSGIGKSTLSSYLVSRGMGFFSDEVAPLQRGTGLVDPFPRRVGVRPGPVDDLVDGLPAEILESPTDRKKLVDPSLLGAPLSEGPLPIHAVVFLTQRITDQVATAQRFDGTVRACVHGAGDGFRGSLLQRTGAVLLSETVRERELVTFELEVATPANFLKNLYAALDDHDASLVGLAYEDTDMGDFSAHPEMAPIPASSGIVELMKKINGFQKRAIIRDEFEGKMSRCIGELTSLMADVPFFKLSPGRLDETIALIEGLP